MPNRIFSLYIYIHPLFSGPLKNRNARWNRTFFGLNEKRYQPPERIELSTPGLQDQCSSHWAMEAKVYRPSLFRRSSSRQINYGLLVARCAPCRKITETTYLGKNTCAKSLAAVGFEPTPPKRLVPKTSALDRSATLPSHLTVCYPVDLSNRLPHFYRDRDTGSFRKLHAIYRHGILFDC